MHIEHYRWLNDAVRWSSRIDSGEYCTSRQQLAWRAVTASEKDTALNFPRKFVPLPLYNRPGGTLSLSVPSDTR